MGGLSGEVVVVGLATGGGYAAGEVLDEPQKEDHPVGESEQMNREVRSADRLKCGSPPHQVSVSPQSPHLPNGEHSSLF